MLSLDKAVKTSRLRNDKPEEEDNLDRVIRVEKMRMRFDSAKDIFTDQELNDEDADDWLRLYYGMHIKEKI